MKAKQVAGGATVTYVMVLDEGEGAFSALSDWAARQQVSAAQVHRPRPGLTSPGLTSPVAGRRR